MDLLTQCQASTEKKYFQIELFDELGMLKQTR